MIDVLDKKRQALDPRLKALLEETTDEGRDYVYCARCAHVVTRRGERVEMNGGHAHYFTNPVGIRFHVGCFARALGCAISGDREAADSWFPGFRWRLASCEDCSMHLGWYFDREDAYFYGLILDNLREQ
jgi:hypothetical protein